MNKHPPAPKGRDVTIILLKTFWTGSSVGRVGLVRLLGLLGRVGLVGQVGEFWIEG
ncbi:hypothetical protein HMPREF9075_01455 [Capnocytophaga sp. oral taxon 332 str. F0381]|nr:hypothetical protein HMPREF9075_01455 [Capnocytophaga sp. oral taxon 332 str. F0381]